MRRSCSVDSNGNDVASDSIDNYDSNNNNSSNENVIGNHSCSSDRSGDDEKEKAEKTISRIQAIGMTDDEDDFGEIFFATLYWHLRRTNRQLLDYFWAKCNK